MYRFAPLAILTVVFCLPLAHARVIESWPYERLLKEADVVVIGKAVSSKDSKETFRHENWSVDFLGVDTTFSVEAVVKGKLDGDNLTLLHYRLKHGVRVDNGPLLVSFRIKSMKLNLKTSKLHLARPSYLLFLKKRADGRFEAVSGQIDSELAVREMYLPLPEEMKKKDEGSGGARRSGFLITTRERVRIEKSLLALCREDRFRGEIRLKRGRLGARSIPYQEVVP